MQPSNSATMSVRYDTKSDGNIKYDFINGDHNNKQCFNNIKRRYYLCTALLVVVILIESSIICCFIITSTDCRHQQNETAPITQSAQRGTGKSNVTEPEPMNSVCFPCAEVGRNITNNDTGKIIRLDKKTNMCCMENVGNLKKLFLLIINEYYRNVKNISTATDQDSGTYNSTKSEDSSKAVEVQAVVGRVGGSDRTTAAPSTTTTLTFWKQREVAAHMFLDNKVLQSSNGTVHRIPWDGRDYHNLSMTSHLLVYDPNTRSIKVKEYGLYFVYSSVTFQAPSTDLNAQVYHTLEREHYLLPNTGPTIMMFNKYGGGKQSSGFYTSFVCGTFRLREGDELFVKVSDMSFLYKLYYSNYLGLYRLSRI